MVERGGRKSRIQACMEAIVRKTMILFFATGLIVPTLNSCKPKSDITQDELLRRSQELVSLRVYKKNGATNLQAQASLLELRR